jgi:hypothetical protein
MFVLLHSLPGYNNILVHDMNHIFLLIESEKVKTISGINQILGIKKLRVLLQAYILTKI